MRNKTDKHARGIAQLLRWGWYSRVHVKSIESHHAQALLSSRKVIQRKCIDLENEIRGLLKLFGVKLPAPLSGAAFDAVVRPIIAENAALPRALLPILEARRVLHFTFVELDRRVKRIARDVANGALNLRMSKQELNRSELPGSPVDQHRLRPP